MRFALTTVVFATSALAHMQLNYPPTFMAANNPHRIDPADDRLQFPYNCCGRKDPYPCRGYLKLLGTPQGAPVATWAAGSKQNFNISGIGNHYGGSCQVGFSVDKGSTFQVATSWEGNCPHRKGVQDISQQNFDFTVPADIPTGDVVFAWTWFNREQEFNMNCAAITIAPGTGAAPAPAAPGPAQAASAPAQGGAAPVASAPTHAAQAPAQGGAAPPSPSSTFVDPSQTTSPPVQPNADPAKNGPNLGQTSHLRYGRALINRATGPVPYAQRPGMLIADTDNGCLTPKGTAEVKYPNPGPDVVPGDGEYPLALPVPPEKCGYSA